MTIVIAYLHPAYSDAWEARWSHAADGCSVVWLIALVALGSAAPSVFSSLAGAGWQANGSESVQVRELAQQHFGGNSSAAVQVVVHSDTASIDDPTVQQRLIDVTAVFDGDTRFGAVIAPQPGMTISPDGHTGILIAGANANADDMVKAVDDVKDELTALSGDGIEVYPTGSSALWSDFNKANHDAMIQAELFSWPVTLAIMVLAFGSLVAAGLPLLLTVAGLVASAGGLVLLNEVTPISVWAMNFAMMFALALGIDYALVHRRPLPRRPPYGRSTSSRCRNHGHRRQSGAPVRTYRPGQPLGSAARSRTGRVRTMAVGIMLAVTFVLIATMTLLPATLGALGPKVNAASLPYAKRQQHRSPKFAAWGELLHKYPWPFALVSVGILVALALPVLGLKVAMPSIAVVPDRCARSARLRVGSGPVR